MNEHEPHIDHADLRAALARAFDAGAAQMSDITHSDAKYDIEHEVIRLSNVLANKLATPTRGDQPKFTGQYVAYVDPPVPGLAYDRVLLFYYEPHKRWGYPSSDQNYRGQVRAFLRVPVIRP